MDLSYYNSRVLRILPENFPRELPALGGHYLTRRARAGGHFAFVLVPEGGISQEHACAPSSQRFP